MSEHLLKRLKREKIKRSSELELVWIRWSRSLYPAYYIYYRLI